MQLNTRGSSYIIIEQKVPKMIFVKIKITILIMIKLIGDHEAKAGGCLICSEKQQLYK